MIAYLGRYGHQPANVMLKMPVRELSLLAEQVNDIVREENAPNKRDSYD